MPLFRILYESPEYVAVDKPSGIHVHPPEDERFRIPKFENGLAILRDQLGRRVYPVHRLDRSTSGVVLYALSSASAGKLARLFSEREIRKQYVALVRGETALTEVLDSPLSESGKDPVDARTDYRRLGRVELPWPNDRFETSRYSLLSVFPETGRYHQIRKHLRRATHPIVGDSIYGDGVHNRHWRAEIGRPYLFLKSLALEFRDPFDGQVRQIVSRWNSEWLRVFDRFGVCPRVETSPRGD